jgi:hypothetical protein
MDGVGNELVEVPFQPNEYHADAPAEEPGVGTFIIPVPANPAIQQATLSFQEPVPKFSTRESLPG